MPGEFSASITYPVFSGYSISKKNSKYAPESVVQVLDTVYQNGRLYTDVLRIYNENDINYTEILFAKDIGMIKRVAKHENFTLKPLILKEYRLK